MYVCGAVTGLLRIRNDFCEGVPKQQHHYGRQRDLHIVSRRSMGCGLHPQYKNAFFGGKQRDTLTHSPAATESGGTHFTKKQTELAPDVDMFRA